MWRWILRDGDGHARKTNSRTMSRGISWLENPGFILTQNSRHFKPATGNFSLRADSSLVTLGPAMEFCLPEMENRLTVQRWMNSYA